MQDTSFFTRAILPVDEKSWDRLSLLRNLLHEFRVVPKDDPRHPRTLDARQDAEAQREQLPLVIEELKSGVVLVLIPGGTYIAGASPDDPDLRKGEARQMRVTLRPFYLGTGPVTQEQWVRMTGENPSCFKGPNRPVETVSWLDVQGFLRQLNSERASLILRLPKEFEWEWAARGGTDTDYWWGSTWAPQYANCERRADLGTSCVGEFPENGFGLLDILGNVWEWCDDLFDANPNRRTRRGGAWSSTRDKLRVTRRGWEDSSTPGKFLGFRVAAGLDSHAPHIVSEADATLAPSTAPAASKVESLKIIGARRKLKKRTLEPTVAKVLGRTPGWDDPLSSDEVQKIERALGKSKTPVSR